MANEGYGSILIEELINIAKVNNTLRINGWISKVDENHSFLSKIWI
ncbi:hypothetical protein [Neobacillus piezotolerans]|nr:hypothetical protein [Neobacillus piezotolerans]